MSFLKANKKLSKELIFFDMTYELIEREKLKANDEDLFKNKKGELSKLSRLRIVMLHDSELGASPRLTGASPRFTGFLDSPDSPDSNERVLV